uniref:tRNA (adenine(58)-N(1))-methyltransferase n=1 Tax=Gasterosteus aculeatus aculeatus TaxID=481459 RepID=G3PHC5_GASAC|nr:tRNA (adenine(58)-N(1))-methyltransferase, mitochondrial isoform X2 [Gasterosteus aculeatus aculeatus]
MAAQMPSAGMARVHRLLKIGTSCQRRLRCKDTIAFSTCSVKCNASQGDSSDSPPSTGLASGSALLSRGRRPLSPLERISSLLAQEALSPEVLQLRERDHLDPEEDVNVRLSGTQGEESGATPEDDPESPRASDAAVVTSAWPPLAPGELLVAEHRRKGRVEFRKMFELQTGARLGSSWGVIPHDDVAGRPAGSFVKTSRGVSILVRRASLEDYVLYMRRGPAIAYPKDASAMLMMMDVTEGDCVLESGSGSGAMSLFLSRAVGCKGSVLSVEVREDHHKRSVLNYKRWRASWSVRRGEEWPDNVRFHTGDLCEASPLLAAHGFHAVALDLPYPQLVLPTVVPHLHPGAVCAVYLANITQVIDLLEGLRCLPLPLLCERIVEVPIRDWLVAPALQKDGRHCVRRDPTLGRDQGEEANAEETSKEEQPAFGSIPYLARPHPAQMSHTAFLVKLRKCVR